MVKLTEIVGYSNELLDIGAYGDYSPNGLQVEGRATVRRLITGVTACQALLDAAVAADADAVLVHHGFFWKGEDPRVVGMKRRRLGTLLANDISLLAYHLPLDGHAELGNNAQLGTVLGLTSRGRFGRDALGVYGELPDPVTGEALAAQIADRLGRQPLHISGAGPIRRVGWCSGGAQGFLQDAAAADLDAFISGEVSEPTFHIARELGIHYFAAGHHATERYGVQALGRHLAERFGLEHRFIDIDNPV